MYTFRMKDLAKLTYFLGLKIIHTNHGIHIHQKKYTKDLLSLTQLSNTKTTDTPIQLYVKFRKDDGSPLSRLMMY